MANETQLNKSLDNENATVINRNLGTQDGSATVLNHHVNMDKEIKKGSILCGIYQVQEKMDVMTGEADLYICSYKGEKYVAKVYRRISSVKAEVSEKLKHIDSPYVAKVYEIGNFNGATVEILPFYRYGSLQKKTFKYEVLRKCVIPSLNKGLKALHDANILHKDLKPSNIMIRDDKKTVAIIDFGISSVTEPGNTVIVTQTGMTPEYSAPETFKGLYSTNADYYSLGITLYELFCGKTPYGNLSAEEIEKYIALQRIPFPKQMPAELRDLIKSLTYYDISNRRDKKNPNRRWGYEEVEKWIRGEKQTIPGSGIEKSGKSAYSFKGKYYSSKPDLVRALAENWSEGKKELFRGKLSDYFKINDFDTYKICTNAEHKATQISGKDDLIFWETLYALEPDTKYFLWKGRVYMNLPALGRDLLEQLRTDNADMMGYMDSMLKEEILSKFVMRKNPKNEAMVNAVKSLESSYKALGHITRTKQINLYLLAYMLSNQKILYVNGQEFHTLGELISYMKDLLGENNDHLEEFREFCHSLMDEYDSLIPAFESWLIALGKREELESWKEEMEAY